MRVTQNTNFNTIRDTIHKTKSRMEGFQGQASTLKRLNKPSDDPIAASKVLEMRTEKVSNEQFSNNAKMVEAFLSNTDHVLSDLSDILLRAKEIAIQQASGASATAETRLGVAEEITQMIQRAIAIGNTKIGDRYLFSGYKTDRPPVDAEGRYLGDDGVMMMEVAKDMFIPMNVTGIEAFNTNPRSSFDGRELYGNAEENRPDRSTHSTSRAEEIARSPANEANNVNVFDELQNLRISLLTNDLTGIRNTLERFDQARDHVISMRAKVGSRVSGLQSTVDSIERQNLTHASLSSKLEDADMVEVMNNIAKEEQILRNVLGSSQKLVQPTLIDFLR